MAFRSSNILNTSTKSLHLNENLSWLNEAKPHRARPDTFYYYKAKVMKTIATIFFVLFVGMAANAQATTKEVKVETIKMTVVAPTAKKGIRLENKVEVARLYKFSNSRVKKELSFTTKNNRTKIA